MKQLFYKVLMAAALALPAQAATIVAQGRSEQARTQQFVLRPDHIGHDFLVKVTAPPTTIQPGQTFPVIYALDGGYDIVPQAAFVLSEGRAMAKAFVVSIGYGSPLGPTTGPRADDMAYTTRQIGLGLTSGGGGAAFEAFLLEELKPFIAARYPVDPDKSVLIGHSQGAQFAATLLLNRPDAYRLADRQLAAALRCDAPAQGPCSSYGARTRGESLCDLRARGCDRVRRQGVRRSPGRPRLTFPDE